VIVLDRIQEKRQVRAMLIENSMGLLSWGVVLAPCSASVLTLARRSLALGVNVPGPALDALERLASAQNWMLRLTLRQDSAKLAAAVVVVGPSGFSLYERKPAGCDGPRLLRLPEQGRSGCIVALSDNVISIAKPRV
jgi:hypothetical protein